MCDRLHLAEEVEDDLDVGLADGVLLDAAGLVERHVEEAGVVGSQPHHLDGRDGLGVADGGLDLLHLLGVHLGRSLGVEVGEDLLDPLAHARGVAAEEVVRHLDEAEVTAHVLVEDGDGPVRHVGDGDVVLVLDEGVEHPAHRDHVVVGVRAEDEDALLARQPALVEHAAAEVLEDGPAELVHAASGVDELVEVVAVEVALVEAEDGLAGLAREPDDGALGGLVVPLHAAHEPRRLLAREIAGGGAVHVERRVLVELEVGRRDLRVGLLLDGLPHDGRLVLARRHEDDLASVEDRPDAHRDGLAGDVLLLEEVRGGVLARDLVEHDEPRAVLWRGARLVEADVAAAADAEQEEVEPARALDGALVLGGVALDGLWREVAARDVDLRLRDVDVVEEVLPHEPVVALEILRRHRHVLVDVEGDDVGEVEPFLAVHPDELLIHADGRRAGGEPQHGGVASGGLGLDERAHLAGGLARELGRLVEDEDGNPLSALAGGGRRAARGDGVSGRGGHR